MILDDILVNLKNGDNQKAYTYQGISYSYREFYKFVCNIYDFIIKEKNNNQPVIVYGQKEVYRKAAFLACSLAGITYVPIDKSMPMERINLIVNQLKPMLIIGDLKLKGYQNISQKEIEDIMQADKPKEIDTIYMKEKDLYYIIFTSGSTGVPKGVKVTYENVNSCIKWLENITNAHHEVILNQANFSFDLSVADLYLSLVSKSEHYILENESSMDFSKVFENLKQSNATIAIMTPSFADLLLLDQSFNENLMRNLRTIIFCGESLLKNTIEQLYDRFKHLRIINMYGPTECTFAVTSIEIPRNAEFEQVPVGKVKEDCEIFIVDENRNVLKDENIGEILITGKSVASGYVQQNQNDKFMIYNNRSAYLTGDLGYIKNGILYYKCRKDKQIKYKGYRIELTDIENNLLKLPYIEKAVVVAKKDRNDKISRMIAFVKIKENSAKTVLEIKQDLRTKHSRIHVSSD